MLVVKNFQPQMTFCDFFGFSNNEEQKSVSGQQTHQLVFLSLEVILGTKTKTKRYKGVVSPQKNFTSSIKEVMQN